LDDIKGQRAKLISKVNLIYEMERKKRGEKSAVIVERLVRAQLRAMGYERFELGIRREGGEMILREGQGLSKVEEGGQLLQNLPARDAQNIAHHAGELEVGVLIAS
jgi:hypothetical protein